MQICRPLADLHRFFAYGIKKIEIIFADLIRNTNFALISAEKCVATTLFGS